MLIEFSEADGYTALSSNQKMVLILHERKAQEFGDHAAKDQKSSLVQAYRIWAYMKC